MRATSEAIAEFGALSFDAIHKLQQEVRQLKAELEEKDRQLELMRAHLETELRRG